MACPVPVSFGYGDSILDPLASDSERVCAKRVNIMVNMPWNLACSRLYKAYARLHVL